jgi:MFS family permease
MQIPPSLRHRQFAIFWLGTIFGWIGNQVLIWAIPWQIRNFTGNPLALGAIGLIRLAPTILVSLFAGVIADKFNRRKVVFITQSVMGLTALGFAVLTMTGTIQLWHIYLLLTFHATTFVFDLPARYSLTPNLVSEENLPNALSVEFLGVQMGNLVGPILSGTLIERLGQPSAYLASTAFFGFILVSLLLLGQVPQGRIPSPSSTTGLAAIKHGLNFTLHHPLIAPGMLLDFLATLLTRAPATSWGLMRVSTAGFPLLRRSVRFQQA